MKIESFRISFRTYWHLDAAQCSMIAHNAFEAAARWLFSKSAKSAVSRTGDRIL
jgi:hypothetical protein